MPKRSSYQPYGASGGGGGRKRTLSKRSASSDSEDSEEELDFEDEGLASHQVLMRKHGQKFDDDDDDDLEDEEDSSEDDLDDVDDDEAAAEAAALARIRRKQTTHDDDEEDDEDDDDEELGNNNNTLQQKPQYDVHALHSKLESIAWGNVPWNEHLSVVANLDHSRQGGPALLSNKPSTAAEPEDLDDVNDDAQRELSFYSQAHDAVMRALTHMQKEGQRWQRPSDYFAEMVKSDEHMAKIQRRLLEEKKQADESEERKKQRALKRYSKQVQSEKLREKAREKKVNEESITKWRKERQRNGYSPLQSEADVDPEYIAMALKAKRQLQGKFGERLAASAAGKSKKRQARDDKHGFGGRKRLKKQNDRDSANDMSSYRPARFDEGWKRAGKVGNPKSASGSPKNPKMMKRPGKAKRAASRAKL